MKNNMRYILYATVAFCTVAITSCEKQLNEYNPGGTTAEDVWSTPQGFLTCVNAAYVWQREWYGKEDGIFNGETGTDLWFNREKDGYGRQNTKYDGLSPLDGNYPKNSWERLWKGVNQCNAGIGRIDKAGYTDMGEKNRRLGELRFLRAFYYYHIVETYGGVMLRTKETDSVVLYAQRSPVEDFYTLMIDDLLFAKDNLPVSWGDEYGRASKKAALGFLARVYLSRAYYSPEGSAEANDYFTKAKTVALDVYNRRAELGCDMWDKVADLWKPQNNKRNKEALYVVTWSSKNLSVNNDTKGNVTHATFLTNYVGKPGLQRSVDYGRENSRRLMPSLKFLDLFDETKDARYEASFQEEWKVNTATPYVWKASDITLYGKDPSVIIANQTTIPVGATALLVTKNAIPDKATRNYVVIDRNDIYNTAANDTILLQKKSEYYVYPALKKFIDLNRPAATPDLDAGYNDIFVMRLAEMLMIAAEAEFKLGNPAGAADQINKLRLRSTKSGQTFTVTAADITTDFILDERAREFCGEWMRWFDLKRMLKGTQFVARIKKYNPDVKLVQDFHRLRPIPQVEIDALLNGATEFKNNPGY